MCPFRLRISPSSFSKLPRSGVNHHQSSLCWLSTIRLIMSRVTRGSCRIYSCWCNSCVCGDRVAQSAHCYGVHKLRRLWEATEGEVLLCYAQAIVRMERSLSKQTRIKQFDYLKIEATLRNMKKRRWWALCSIEMMQQQAKKALSEPLSLSLWRLTARAEYATTSFALWVTLILYERPRSQSRSTSKLQMNVTTPFSVLEDGERWEAVKKETKDDEKTELHTRVEELTAAVEGQTAVIKDLRELVEGIALKLATSDRSGLKHTQ